MYTRQGRGTRRESGRPDQLEPPKRESHNHTDKQQKHFKPQYVYMYNIYCSRRSQIGLDASD